LKAKPAHARPRPRNPGTATRRPACRIRGTGRGLAEGPSAVERARIGREREKALSAIYRLRQEIARTPAHSLADAAALLLRLAVTMEADGDADQARLVASALAAVEQAVSDETRPVAAVA
jgi:hypothetical protein